MRGDEELWLGRPAPAAKAGGVDELVATGIEDADVHGVARSVPERRRHRLRVPVRNVYAQRVLRHLEGEIEVRVLPYLFCGDLAVQAERLLQRSGLLVLVAGGSVAPV